MKKSQFKQLIREEISHKIDNLVSDLETNDIRCKIIITDEPEVNVHIYLGFNFPFDLGDKVADLVRKNGIGFNRVYVAELPHISPKAKVMFEKDINGGPIDYPKKLRENKNIKKSQLRQLVKEEVRSMMDKWPFNQGEDHEEEYDDTPNEIGAEVYQSENYIMKSHPHRVDKFYVTDHNDIVKCIGSATKCMNFIQKHEVQDTHFKV